MVLRAATLLVMLFAGVGPVLAVIQRTIALQSVIEGERWIGVGRIGRLDAARAEVTIVRNLKGDDRFSSLSLALTGDAQAVKSGEPRQLLERLAPGMEIVLFGSLRGGRWTMVGYSNGTWFRLAGEAAAGSPAVISFTHFEPYLRRTYNGATAELIGTITDCLGGRGKPPAPNPQEPPGIGPPVKP